MFCLFVCFDLDVDEVRDERHEDHLVSIPALSGVHFDPAFQLPPLPAVPHEDLMGRHGKSRRKGNQKLNR